MVFKRRIVTQMGMGGQPIHSLEPVKDIFFPALALKLEREVVEHLHRLAHKCWYEIDPSIPVGDDHFIIEMPVFVNYNYGPEIIARLIWADIESLVVSLDRPPIRVGNFSPLRVVSREVGDIRLHDLTVNWAFACASTS